MEKKNKISFIICVNDEMYFEECLFYINRLRVPEGFEIDVFAVREAASIYQAYNQAMESSDAKYKVYMHQDVSLIDKDILMHFLEFFEAHSKAGMAGVLGGQGIPADRRFYRAWDVGNVAGCGEDRAFHNELIKEEKKVFAVDGMFLMTQYDVPWREDILEGWDFYDFSQSLEFLYRGYEVWVPAQPEYMCIHDCGYLNFMAYDESQKKFLQSYQNVFPDYTGQNEVYPALYRERFLLMMELKQQCKILMFEEDRQILEDVLRQAWDERFFDTEFAVLKNILEILKEEEKQRIEEPHGFLHGCHTFEQAYQKYLKIKFYLRRQRYAPEDTGICPIVSEAAKHIIGKHVMLEGEKI